MTIKEFFGKLTSKIIWVNLLAMFLIIVAIAVGIWIGLERYTMHGVEITRLWKGKGWWLLSRIPDTTRRCLPERCWNRLRPTTVK